MIVAKVTSPRIKDRFFKLVPGICRIGADLGCTVVLLDEVFQPVHMVLHATEDTVDVEINDGATAELHTGLTGTVSTLRGGDRRAWHAGDILQIENVRIELEGIRPDYSASGCPAGTNQIKPTARRLTPVAGALVAAIIIVCLLQFEGWAVPVPSQVRTEAWANMPLPVLDAPAITRKLGALGLTPSSLTQRDGRWTAILRVGDEDALQLLNSKLERLDFPFEPEVYVDAQLRRAAEMALANLAAGMRVLSVKDGVIELSPLRDVRKSAETIQNSLLRDVPGLLRVAFDKSTENDLTQARAALAAIWTGEYPYVVLSDSSIVRPGDTLRPGITLVSVHNEYVVVEINYKNEKMKFHD
ncbi:hypothetical protein ACVIHI_009124 [Bradyrhizobium sp. USDA 4524]|uniref:FHA domain-containing protein n=1 Tax=unclassified Bradyrhizobium TaxID=2631580 RepID=UPI00209CC5EC|nr:MULTISPECIES: FHA domain-containing protein [unclassified Bradyrhizobium]MCP1846097.1 hypothetical protein [Bradyrhizobium sp. USDA 4538]MCP1907269.1 hypothetical protein [Bradyrhizobium sp. USDA 4537]MCP1985744.1 hypothetical protein [Bradyrhizobium sp. USDA 4539]